MIVLLVISTVVAIIAPQPAQRLAERRDETVTPSEPEDPGWPDPDTSGLRHDVVDTERDELPKRIVARAGERLRLEVTGGPGRMVAIPDLGLLQTQSRTAPASFEILADEAGSYEVIDAESGRGLALIVVEEEREVATAAEPAAEKS